MTHDPVNELASSFVQMAKAFEELPRVKHELSQVQHHLAHTQDTVQRLELKLIDRNTTIDELNAKVRKAEADRDDAELRFLEADEKLNTIVGTLTASAEVLGLKLTKPEPVQATWQTEPAQAQPVTESPAEIKQNYEDIQQRPEPFSPESSPNDPVEVKTEAVDPIAQAESAGNGADVTSTGALPTEDASANTTTDSLPTDPIYPAPGQSDPLPTVASPIDGSSAASTNASPLGDVSSQTADYGNEPADRWGPEWYRWADKMDAQHGKYHWPSKFA